LIKPALGGMPVAVWLAVRYLFVPQVTMPENLGGRRALARSSALARGRVWHTALVAVLVWAAVESLALALGLLLLIAALGLPLWTVSALVVACQATITPAGAICLTLLYGDARAEHDAKHRLPDDATLAPSR
jgi:hypothetical protein